MSAARALPHNCRTVYELARRHGYRNEVAARIEYAVECLGRSWDSAVAFAFYGRSA